MVEKSDFPPVSGQLSVQGTQGSREPSDRDPTLRFIPRPEAQTPGPSSQRGATMMLPDARRDPSCVQALAGAPPSERAPRPGFMPVPKTQLLGTRGADGSIQQDAGAAAQSRSPTADTAQDSDLPPPRSVIRSRPWVEIPDSAGSGIRRMPELEAAALTISEDQPAPPSRRGRGRRAVQPPSSGLTAPLGPDGESLRDSPPISFRRVEPMPSDPTGSLTIPGAPDARARRERLIFMITFAGAILSVIGVVIWLGGSRDRAGDASAAAQGPAATAAPATPTTAPPQPAALTKVAAETRATSQVSARAVSPIPPALQRQGQKPQPAGGRAKPRSQNEVVDPWDN